MTTAGWVSVGNHSVKMNELSAGTRVGIRLDGATLTLFDLDSHELLRSHPSALSTTEILKVRGARLAGPTHQPRTDPIPVRRRAPSSSGIYACGQKITLGRRHARKTVIVHVGYDTPVVELDDGSRSIRRIATQPLVQIKAQRPRTTTNDHQRPPTTTNDHDALMTVGRVYLRGIALVQRGEDEGEASHRVCGS